MLLNFWKRPSVWVGLVAIVAYSDPQALRGEFVYDDAGSVKRNVVVTGMVPLSDLFKRDYWGTPMKDATSHKSFRPVTTLSFWINWKLSERWQTAHTKWHTFGFHVANVVLHGVVSGLVVEVAALVFACSTQAASHAPSHVLSGLLFAVHPVHAEAVSNVTSRGELLMSAFYLAAFLSYFYQEERTVESQSSATTYRQRFVALVRVYLLPVMCTAFSMFSKEQGATCLLAVVAMDFVQRFGSLQGFVDRVGRGYHRRHKDRQRQPEEAAIGPPSTANPESSTLPAHDVGKGKSEKQSSNDDDDVLQFVVRAVALGMQTVAVCLGRMYINGETKPDFIVDQNPAGFAADRFTRIFSVNWVYCLYVRDYLWPTALCPDWSGRSIDLLASASDVRVLGVLALWAFIGWCIYQLLFLDLRTKDQTQASPSSGLRLNASQKQQALIAFWSFVACPFLLSSNLLVVVGLMKADRVIYLPLAGLCMLQAWLFDCFQRHPQLSSRTKSLVQLAVLIQMGALCAKTHERNVAWSTSELLWQEAYRVNPRSYHTMYNYGYELSLRKKYVRAERVLRPIADPHVNGPSNTFVYAMVLQNLNRCDEANRLMDRALALAERQQREAADEAAEAAAAAANESSGDDAEAAAAVIGRNVRNTESSYARVKSNLLVARSFCSQDVGLAGKYMYDAVQADPTNEYAVEQAKAMLAHYEKLHQQQRLLSDLMGQRNQP
jgi:protein O-mannosyl-transferase